MGNFWNNLMGSVEEAGNYMLSYDEGPGSDTRMQLSEFVNIGESVLDVGCGPGHNMEHFAEYGPRISRYKGVDYASYFVEAANQRRQAKFPTDYALPFEVQDCRDLKERDNTWDVVLLQDCVEHTNGYEKPVREALRVAKQRVVVVFWHLTENDDHMNDDGDDGYGSWYSRPKWEEFLDSLGYPWEWCESAPNANRHHDFYVIEKEVVANA